MVRHDAPAHGLQSGLSTPVIFVGRKQRVLLFLVFCQHPGAGAHIAGNAVLGLTVNKAVGRNNTEWPHKPQFHQGGIVRMREHKAVRVRVHHFVALNLVNHFKSMPLPVGNNGVHVQLDGGGIKGCAVCECHALAQMKCIHPAIGRNFPAFGKAGLHTLGGVHHQRFKHHTLGGHFPGVEMGIDDADVLGAGVDHFSTLHLGSGFFIILAGGYVQAADQGRQYKTDFSHIALHAARQI